MKFQIALSFILVIIVLIFLPNATPNTQADVNNCAVTITNPRADGLISTPELLSNIKTSSGACIVDPKAAFAPYKVPSYNDLKSLYYTQSKANEVDATPPGGGEANQGNLRSSLNSHDVIFFNSNLRLGNVGGSPKTAVVFVENNLYFDQNFTLDDNNTGLVFIVKGDVNIASTVTQIDAVIISAGTIYTAGANCATSNVPTTQLIINGSLISINQTDAAAVSIKFCRTLADNTVAAEQINNQVKYLVILRDLMSDTFQRWSETP